MNILYAALAVALGLGGAIGANSLLQGGTKPATALSAQSPAPSKPTGGLGSYVDYQKALLPVVFPKAPGDGLPPPEYRISGEGCVIALDVRSWAWRADAEATMLEAYRKMAVSMGKEDTTAPPASPFPGTAQDGERILTHSYEKFDLRSFDLEAVTRKDAEGFVIGIVGAAPFTGGNDPTNRAIVDVMVANAPTPDKAEGIREFGQKGRMKFNLPFGDFADPQWQQTKGLFEALREAALTDRGITNITMGVSSSVLQDGTRRTMSGGLKQPRHFPIYASSGDDLDRLLAGLRDHRRRHCE